MAFGEAAKVSVTAVEELTRLKPVIMTFCPTTVALSVVGTVKPV